jgi:hypothetical protein
MVPVAAAADAASGRGECGGMSAHTPGPWVIDVAPDLLEALRGVVRVADRATVEFDAARAAIAKATGATP